METVTFVLRFAVVAQGLLLLALSAGSLTRPGVCWPQRCRFIFIGGIAAVAALRGAEVFTNDDPMPLWTLIAVNALLAVGVWGGAMFYREFPATRWPKKK